MGSAAGAGALAAAVALAGACSPTEASRGTVEVVASAGAVADAGDPLAPLREWENRTRETADFTRVPASDGTEGTDPYVVRRMAGTPARLFGVLRGRAATVELDPGLHEVARAPAPDSPSGLAVGTGALEGALFAVGELSSHVARYRTDGGLLRPDGTIDLPGVLAMRDVAVGPEGVVYVVEEHDGRLLTLRPGPAGRGAPPASRVDLNVGHGAFRVRRVGGALVVDCLLDHTVLVMPVDARGFPVAARQARITHDGPIWSTDALPDGDSLLVATGGVEDHPLDRTEGSFGFVDSFLTLYRVTGTTATRLAEVNTSALGVVTPKALSMSRTPGGGLHVVVSGYASDKLAVLDWPAGDGGASLGDPAVQTRPVPPGTASLEPLGSDVFAVANPLLDAWVLSTPATASVVHVDDDASRARPLDARVGESLFFTTLMAPWDSSEGRLSRFTCETCHFEGFGDGRTHATGRGDIHATTKPLMGLFNNRPHFSRALDPDMTTMVNNEFRVAAAKSEHDPWFSVSPQDFPWLNELSPAMGSIGPEALRRDLMTFLMAFTHRPNPAVVGRDGWTPVERAGAEVFRDRCESCHEARLVADEPGTRRPFEQWEPLVMSREGAIVWAHAEYEKTGVEPYVNERGARVVSLRRLYMKHPYFTNGSAKELRDVLDGVGVSGGAFFHAAAPAGAARLSGDDKRALSAFLDLL